MKRQRERKDVFFKKRKEGKRKKEKGERWREREEERNEGKERETRRPSLLNLPPITLPILPL